MEQLHAGYFPEAITKMYSDSDKALSVKNLMNMLSYFDADFIASKTPVSVSEDVDNIAKTGLNLLSSKLPSLPTVELEKYFAKTHLRTKDVSNSKNIHFDFKHTHESYNELKDAIYKALHIVDPRLRKEDVINHNRTWENIAGEFEKDFAQLIVPAYTKECFNQFFHFTRPYNSLVKKAKQHKQEAVDFAIEIPYSHSNRGLLIEIDGPIHRDINQRKIDVERDEELEENGWGKPIRITTDQGFQYIKDSIVPLQDFFKNQYFVTVAENYENPLYDSEIGMDALELALSPLAISRLKTVLLSALQKGMLNLLDDKWHIAIIERDVPCAQSAIRDFKFFFKQIASLFGNIKLPTIEVEVFCSPEFLCSRQNTTYLNDLKMLSEFDENNEYQLVIDLSVLQNFNSKHQIKSKKNNRIIVRSALSRLKKKCLHQLNNNAVQKILTALDSEVKPLEYLLRTIFRNKAFYKYQLQLIKQILGGENILSIQPSNSGKTLACIFAATLTGKPLLMVSPSKVLATNQNKELEEINIDSSIYTSEEEYTKSNITYIVAATLRDPSFIEHSKHKFPIIVFDEAHRMSEWSHDFCNTLSGSTTGLKSEKVQLVGITSTASYDVVNNICEELNIRKKNVSRHTAFDRPEIKYNILEVNTYLPKDFADSDKIASLIAVQKQNLAWNVLQELSKRYESTRKVDTLFLCPEIEGAYGVNNATNSGLYNKLANKKEPLQINYFVGNDNKSIAQQQEFVNDKVEVLVAHNQWAVGNHKENIREVVGINMPPSIEHLVQQAGRAAHDQKAANYNLLYSRLKNENIAENKKPKYTDNYDVKQALNTIKKNFPSKQKELAVVYEFLSQISYPQRCEANFLEDQLSKQFSEKITLGFYPEKFPYNVHIYIDQQHLGQIYYPGAKITYDEIYPDGKFTELVANYIIEYLHDNCPEDDLPLKWLSASNKSNSNEGLLALLDNMAIGEKQNITFDFRNDAIEQMIENLEHNNIELASAQEIVEMYRSKNTFELFYKAILNTYFKGKVEPDNNIENRIRFLYHSVRTEKETKILLHRLHRAGIIEQYTLDEKTQKVTALIVKKSHSDYENHLALWFKQYIAENKANEYLSPLAHSNNFITDLLNALISFIYKEVIGKRKKSLHDVYKICELGVLTKSSDGFNVGLKDFVSLYFNAKYANKKYAPSLYLDTEKLTVFSYKIVLKYINISGHNRDNWRQLQVSCRKLLKKVPNNYLFILLEAYTDLLLNTHNVNNVDSAIDRIMLCFKEVKAAENFSSAQYIKHLKLFFERIFIQNNALRPFVEPLATAKIHNQWLSIFKAKFLEGYGKQ